MYVSTQPQYVNNGGAYANVNDSKAIALLKAQGFKKGSDGYFQPNYGPEKGQDLTLTISTTTGNTTRAQTEQLFQGQMKKIGIKINIQNFAAGTFFGTNLPQGLFDIAEFAWVPTPFVSANQSIYCSYTNAANCGQNYNHFANKAVDTLMANGSSAATAATETSDFNKADAMLWANMVTLPLYQKPQFFAWSGTAHNVVPNTASVGLPWNGNLWTSS
jgi:peptide/nickel transport system substrate-binding protein